MNKLTRKVNQLPRRAKIVIAICFIATLCASFFMGGAFWAQNGQSTRANPPQPYSYLVYTDGKGNYYLKNGATGQVDFCSTSFGSIMSNAQGNLTNGGAIFCSSGTYVMDLNFSVTNNQITIEGIGDGTHWQMRYFAAAPSINMIRVLGNYTTIKDILFDGNLANSGNGVVGGSATGCGIAIGTLTQCVVGTRIEQSSYC